MVRDLFGCVLWGLFCFGLPAFLGGLGHGFDSLFWLLIGCCILALCWVWWFFGFFFGEFDPGSGRTLAACLTHASRTVKPSLLGG